MLQAPKSINAPKLSFETIWNRRIAFLKVKAEFRGCVGEFVANQYDDAPDCHQQSLERNYVWCTRWCFFCSTKQCLQKAMNCYKLSFVDNRIVKGHFRHTIGKKRGVSKSWLDYTLQSIRDVGRTEYSEIQRMTENIEVESGVKLVPELIPY